MKLSYTVRAVACVCGASLFHFILGTIYTFGNLSPYISSYLKLRTSNTWVTTGHTVWIFSSLVLISNIVMPFAGIVYNKIGIRLICVISTLILSMSFILTYLSIQSGLWAIVMTYGVGSGVALAFGYSVCPSAAINWFPDHPGLISGIVSAGFGFGSFIFYFIQTYFINPSNISPILSNRTSPHTQKSKEKYFYDENILNRVPWCFVVMGAMFFVIDLVAIALMRDRDPLESKENKEIKSIMIEDEKPLLNRPEEQKKSTIIEFSVLEAVKHKMFWLLFFTLLFNGFYILIVVVHYKSFGQEFIDDDHYFTVLGAIGAIFNSLSRIVWGRLFDMFGYRKVMSTVIIMGGVTMGTFYFVSFIANQKAAKAVYFIWVCVLFIAQGGHLAIMPSVTTRCFGFKNMATIYGMIFNGLSVSCIIGALISSMLFHVMRYRGQFFMTTVASVISLILTQFYEQPTAIKMEQ